LAQAILAQAAVLLKIAYRIAAGHISMLQ